MKLLRLSIGYSCVASVLACSSGSAVNDAVLQRIERVENGMLPAVVVSGAEPPRQTIQDVMQRYHVSGVSVAVINDCRLEWAKGYGVKEIGGAPVDTATLFLAGHISQGVAAIVSLKLVDDGVIALDRDVNDYLTSWKVPEDEFTATEKVTVRRILSHTSGLSVSSLVGYAVGETLPTTIQILDSVSPATNQAVRVLGEPGSQQRYSVGGYVVLQQLLQDVSGVQYASLVHDAVLVPLAMNRSFHAQPLTEALAGNAASGYQPSNEVVPGRWRVYPELAALGMWTTPSDLARLALGIQRCDPGVSNAVFSSASTAEMLSHQFENRGLGFEVGGEGEWRFFRLEGHGNNYLSELYAYASQGKGAVVMTNSSNGQGVTGYILRAIAAEYGWPDLVPEEVTTAVLPETSLRELEGRYTFRGRDWMLSVEDGRILRRTVGDREEELLALSEDELVSVSFGYRYAVERDSAHSITGLTLILQGTRLFTYERDR